MCADAACCPFCRHVLLLTARWLAVGSPHAGGRVAGWRVQQHRAQVQLQAFGAAQRAGRRSCQRLHS
eukprot:351235-Chlamydomonas_euryale.AAC.3